MFNFAYRAAISAACLVFALAPTLAPAQVVAPGAAPSAAQPLPAAVEQTVTVPEGTEFPLRLDETLSSKQATEGDRFAVVLDDDVNLGNGVILRAGYRGVGEVVEARDNGMLGKTGKLNIRINYLRVGDQRIRLRANKGAKGGTNTGAQVVSVVLFWPVAPFIKGKNTSIKKGTVLSAFTDQDVQLPTPIPPPPED
jgi:hypothetical protein